MGVGWPNGNVVSHPDRSMLTSALGGEIDIFEGVNMQDSNQMTLHTGPGCIIPRNVYQTGTALGRDCGSSPSNNAGCGVMDSNTKSYGKPFADSGGGVWVTQFDTSGIRIWFVPVSDNTCGAIFTRLTSSRDQRCLKVESLPIPVNSEPLRPSSLRPAAIPPPSLQIK